MNNANNASSRKQLEARGCIMMACGAIAISLILGGTSFYIWRASVARRVDAKLAMLSAKGEPTTPAELDVFRALPKGTKDVTQLWLVAIAPFDTPQFATAAQGLPIVGSSDSQIPPIGKQWAHLQAVEDFLEEYRASMDGLHMAAKAMDDGGDVSYPLDFEQGIAMPLPHIQQLRVAARMLHLEMLAKAHRGDFTGAADSIHGLNKAADSLANEPVIVSMLVRVALMQMAVDGLQDLLTHLSEEDLQRLAKDFGDLGFADNNRKAMLGERVLGTQAIRNPDASGGPSIPFSADNLEVYLEYLSMIVDVSNQPFPDSITGAQSISSKLQTDMQNAGMAKYRMISTSMLVPAVDASVCAAGRGEASGTLATTAIAMERYRRNKGELPASIDQLVPEFLTKVPTDPMDGMPLRYIREKAIIYSLGQNLTDDGGSDKDAADALFRLAQ